MGENTFRWYWGLVLIALLLIPNTLVAKSKKSRQVSCERLLLQKLLRPARDANAVCRPKRYSPKSMAARLALRRANYWHKKAREIREKELENESVDRGPASINLIPPLTYDQAVQYLYMARTEECDEMNDKFADAIILLSHNRQVCQDHPMFSEFRRNWRDNRLMLSVYQRYSGSAPTPGAAAHIIKDIQQ